MQPIFLSPDLNVTFNALAISITNNMRNSDDNGTLINGGIGVAVYKIRWQWICLPLIFFFGSGVFLVTVILQTRGHQPHTWKSSSLAVLKCGGQMRDLFKEEMDIKSMEEKANKSHVLFTNNPRKCYS